MKQSTTRGARLLTCLAAASLTAALIVPAASSAVPSAATAATATENIVFTSVSNVLKLRHDTAKNSVAN